MDNIIIERIVAGNLYVNTYIINRKGASGAIVIDPAGDAAQAIKYLKDNKLNCEMIILTHGHFDHIEGLANIRNGSTVAVHERDAQMLTDTEKNLSVWSNRLISYEPAEVLLTDGVFEVAGLTLKILHTPGHTPGSICVIIDECIISGDTLFRMSVGRVDFAHSNSGDMKISLKKLMDLPHNFKVLPGHGDETTLGFERKNNPFVNSWGLI